jgi:hypothetical protein
LFRAEECLATHFYTPNLLLANGRGDIREFFHSASESDSDTGRRFDPTGLDGLRTDVLVIELHTRSCENDCAAAGVVPTLAMTSIVTGQQIFHLECGMSEKVLFKENAGGQRKPTAVIA